MKMPAEEGPLGADCLLKERVPGVSTSVAPSGAGAAVPALEGDSSVIQHGCGGLIPEEGG